MRRILAYVLTSLGLLLIFLAPFFRFYAAPRVEKAPLGRYEKTLSLGTGTYFSTKTFDEVGPHRMSNVSTYRGDVKAGSQDVAVYDSFSATKDLETGDVIDFGPARYVFDRTTGYAVRCCGANPPQDGVTLKFPFGTEKRTYPFWDSTAKKAFPARFVSAETLNGLDVYLFRQDIPRITLGTQEIPGSLANQPDKPTVEATRNYQAVTLLWVEPVTGAVIKGSQRAVQWFTDTNGDRLFVIADTDIAYAPSDVADTASEVKSKLGQLRLVTSWIPLFGLIIGIPLLVIGFLLQRRQWRTSLRTEHRAAPATVS